MHASECTDFTPEELQRYRRHLCLPDFGIAAQTRLKQARVLIVGAGGLGCPAAIYLAAAGVGAIGLVEFDTVDASNLQRQILFGEADVGQAKLKAAEAALQRINGSVQFNRHDGAFDVENAAALVADYDVVLDATDNFSTRYLINDACVLGSTPCCYGSVLQYGGQLAVFAAAAGPCYRCLYPVMPPPDRVPDCAEAGVLGVLPGVIGTMQATEAIKLLTGIGAPLIGRLLLYDALAMRTRELQLAPDPDCPVCGSNPTITTLRRETAACTASNGVQNLDCDELDSLLRKVPRPVLLDVRQPFEYDAGHLPGAQLIPLPQLEEQVGELPQNDTIVVYCEHGLRSGRAARILQDAGCREVFNLVGGLRRWRQTGGEPATEI